MLRSIFSLIQNIIDSDKEYNNKKFDTIIYLVSNPDNSLNVDMEIDGKERRNIKSLKEIDKEDPMGSFTITTDQGDTVTCKHFTDKQIRAKAPTNNDEKLQKEYTTKIESERSTFYNKDEHTCVEDDESCKLKSAKEPYGDHGAPGSANMDEFMQKLYEKQTRFFERDQDQITALLDQIQKMKKGMERLQEIAQQFNCSEKFRQDVEYLMKNVASHVENEPKDTKLAPSKR